MTTPTTTRVAAFLLLLLLSSAAVSLGAKTASKLQGGQQQAGASVYMVMVKRPAQGVNYKEYQLRILATALGSEEKAKQVLIYSYKNVASGFAAKLTQPQLAALKKQPEVVQALPDVKYTLQDKSYLN